MGSSTMVEPSKKIQIRTVNVDLALYSYEAMFRWRRYVNCSISKLRDFTCPAIRHEPGDIESNSQ